MTSCCRLAPPCRTTELVTSRGPDLLSQASSSSGAAEALATARPDLSPVPEALCRLTLPPSPAGQYVPPPASASASAPPVTATTPPSSPRFTRFTVDAPPLAAGREVVSRSSSPPMLTVLTILHAPGRPRIVGGH